jgi:hypothetical protein
VRQGDPPDPVRRPAQCSLPITDAATVLIAVRLAGDDELGDDTLDDSVEQGILVSGVPVDRHRVAIEGFTEPTHRQGLNTVFVDDLQGGGQDLLTGQRATSPG